MQRRMERAKAALREADCVLIGGGAGLSAAAGLEYGGKRFQSQFAPFIRKYGLTDMYSAGFYPFPTQEEKWAYWAKHILVNRYDPPAAALYAALRRMAGGTDFFVITTNVDGQFAKAGFPPEKLFATQGDYRYLQCARGCHDRLYDNEALVREMAAHTVNCQIPSELVPRCPVCGGRMAVHLRCDPYFVQNNAWYDAQNRYEQFLRHAAGRRVVLLELGVGYQTPVIIRYPFEQITFQNKKATLIRLNRDDPGGAKENAARTIAFNEDMTEVIGAL